MKLVLILEHNAQRVKLFEFKYYQFFLKLLLMLTGYFDVLTLWDSSCVKKEILNCCKNWPFGKHLSTSKSISTITAFTITHLPSQPAPTSLFVWVLFPTIIFFSVDHPRQKNLFSLCVQYLKKFQISLMLIRSNILEFRPWNLYKISFFLWLRSKLFKSSLLLKSSTKYAAV